MGSIMRQGNEDPTVTSFNVGQEEIAHANEQDPTVTSFIVGQDEFAHDHEQEHTVPVPEPERVQNRDQEGEEEWCFAEDTPYRSFAEDTPFRLSQVSEEAIHHQVESSV